jgi:hypothetical protein
VAINRVPLLIRTIEQVQERDPDATIYISSLASNQTPVAGCLTNQVDNASNLNYGNYSSWLSLNNKWNNEGKTILLSGATFFSDYSLDKMCTLSTEGITVYGRRGTNKYGISSRLNEIYGLSIPSKFNKIVFDSMTKVLSKCSNGDNTKITLMDVIENLDSYKWINFNDITEEIRTPKEYHTIMNTSELLK